MRAANRILAQSRARWARALRPQYRASSDHVAERVKPPVRLQIFDDPNSEIFSPEYIQKNFGFLQDAKNKPISGHSIASGVVTSKAVLEAIAEINGTEFHFSKLDAKTLKAKYAEQLNNFETARRSALEREGQPEVVIQTLRDLYTVRANVSLWEIDQAIRDLGFLGGDNTVRVTKRELEDHPIWKSLPGLSGPFSPTYGHPEGESLAGKMPEEVAAANVKLLRGLRGIVNALQKGFTDDQYNHLFSILEKKIMTPERASALIERFEQVRSSLSDKKLTRADLRNNMGPFLDTLSPEEEDFLDEHLQNKEDALATLTEVADTDNDQFKAGIKKALDKAKSKNKSKGIAASSTRLEKAIDFLLKDETQRKFRLLDFLERANLSTEEMVALLAPFDDNSLDDAVLNDVQNAHPIAERLWGDRMAWMADENLYYTKKYEDLDDNGLYKDVHEVDQNRLKKYESAMEAPILGPYPFNSGIE